MLNTLRRKFGILCVGAFVAGGLVSCTPGTDYQKRIVLTAQKTKVRSAISSKYFIPKGADVSVRYAEGSLFYVQKGGKLSLLEKGGRNNQVFVEVKTGVTVTNRGESLRVRLVADAKKAFNGHYTTASVVTSNRHRDIPREVTVSAGEPARFVEEVYLSAPPVVVRERIVHHHYDSHDDEYERRAEEREKRREERRTNTFKEDHGDKLREALRKKFKK